MKTKPIEKVSIIVLTRNEEKNISSIIKNINENIKKSFEIVVVDYSTDKTPYIVKKLSKKYPNTKLIPQIKKGYTNAIITGIENSDGDALVVMVADLSDEVRDIEKMRDKLDEGYDIICASRYMKKGKKIGGSVVQSFFSFFVGKSLNFLIKIPTSDISNSFKMYRKKVFNSIEIENSNYAASMQILLKAFIKGFLITEIPTIWRDRTEGKAGFSISGQARYYIYWYLWGIFKAFTKKKARRE